MPALQSHRDAVPALLNCLVFRVRVLPRRGVLWETERDASLGPPRMETEFMIYFNASLNNFYT
jgi:hypothetical protein